MIVHIILSDILYRMTIIMTITDYKQIGDLTDNKIIFAGEYNCFENSRVNFTGKNNILYIEKGATLKNSTINFLC